ncbi:MAG: four helix bundle protein [Prevotellaceae bacterium]|jgi:four helix bundle protein|nr:four helix bundle protein [Prevotellaceae bacterium]
MHNFRKLEIWIEARRLVKEIYLLTLKFPSYEQFGLSSQLRRAAISIPSNIAEGSAKSSNKEFARFLEHSTGSSFEAETQLTLAFDLNYINNEEFDNIVSSIQKHQIKMCNFKNKLQQ